jgi:DNA-directed RNA polymerase subunit L
VPIDEDPNSCMIIEVKEYEKSHEHQEFEHEDEDHTYINFCS